MRADLGMAFHTFTMMARCPRDGALGICLTSSPLSVGARCPFIESGVGAVSTQAYSDPGLGPLALNLLKLGYSPDKVLKELYQSDEWPEYRQVGIIDKDGRTGVFTGDKNLDWKGHVTGDGYIAMGNYLTSGKVIEAMAKSFEATGSEILEERLVRAIEAGQEAGGEKGGQLSSALVVVANDTYPRTDLRVDMATEAAGAVAALRRVYDEYAPLIPYYEMRPRNPKLESWREWRAKHAGADG